MTPLSGVRQSVRPPGVWFGAPEGGALGIGWPLGVVAGAETPGARPPTRGLSFVWDTGRIEAETSPHPAG